MAYVLLLDDLRRRADNALLVAGMARAAGADVELPDWDSIRADFDQHLISPMDAAPVVVDDRTTMLRALGLR